MDPVEARLLADIGERPDDADTRLIYADWLEQHGALGRANFLRAQLALSQLADADPAFHAAVQAVHALLPETDASWRTLVAQTRLENCTFVVQCTKRWDMLTPTGESNVRHCGACQRSVHYAATSAQLRHHAEAGDCVVVDQALARRPGDASNVRYVVAPENQRLFSNPPPPTPNRRTVWGRLRKLLTNK